MNDVKDTAAVAVVGLDAVATGRAALDLAYTEARQRLVTVVDLIGDSAPLRRIMTNDDPHGVADCFAYGLSFAAVSRPTSVDPRVSLISSGSEPIAYADVLRSDRWERLISQARESGALIVFAALSATPGLDALTARVDYVLPATLVLPPPAPVVSTPPSPPIPRPQHRSTLRLAPVAPPASRYRRHLSAAAVVGVALIAGSIWFVRRAPSRASAASTTIASVAARRPTDTLTSSAQLAAADRSAGASAPIAGGAAPSVADPQDSALASAYAIRVGTYPTYASALRDVRSREVKRGAATVTPLTQPGPAPGPSSAGATPAQSFVVYVGAARSAAALDSTARSWTRAGGFAGGTVTHTPYALRLTERVTADSAVRATVAWRARGIPAYSLVGDDGQARVYAGAFTSVDQAVALTASLHAAGLTPIVAYRIGQAP